MALDFENGTETKHFLGRILPKEGIYQATIIKNGRAQNIPCASIAELAEEVLKRDRPGQNVFHACATYKDGSSRMAINAVLMNAFWLDLDCGPEKAITGAGYKTKLDATWALREFCGAVGLPRPMIVDSGGGLHVYWPLKETITAERWKVIADKLKRATKALGFLADQSRTADAASVLRPVGTFNRKYDPPRPVVLLRDAASDVDPDQFETAVDSFLAKPKRKQQAHQSGLVGDTPRQRARLASMLSCISADCAYEMYRDVVWALLSLGWEDAPDLAEAWCLTAPDRFDADNFIAILSSHDAERSPSIGTLIYLAREGGWHG